MSNFGIVLFFKPFLKTSGPRPVPSGLLVAVMCSREESIGVGCLCFVTRVLRSRVHMEVHGEQGPARKSISKAAGESSLWKVAKGLPQTAVFEGLRGAVCHSAVINGGANAGVRASLHFSLLPSPTFSSLLSLDAVLLFFLV